MRRRPAGSVKKKNTTYFTTNQFSSKHTHLKRWLMSKSDDASADEKNLNGIPPNNFHFLIWPIIFSTTTRSCERNAFHILAAGVKYPFLLVTGVNPLMRTMLSRLRRLVCGLKLNPLSPNIPAPVPSKWCRHSPAVALRWD